MATTAFRDGLVEEVRLYPLDLGQGGGPDRKALPHLASHERARAILESLQKASIAFGTKIEIDGSVVCCAREAWCNGCLRAMPKGEPCW